MISWPSYVVINDSDPEMFVQKIQRIPLWYQIDDWRYVTIDEGVEQIVRLAQANVVEASFVDRCPGHSADEAADHLDETIDQAIRNVPDMVHKETPWARNYIAEQNVPGSRDNTSLKGES